MGRKSILFKRSERIRLFKSEHSETIGELSMKHKISIKVQQK